MRINSRIRVREVRVVGEAGEQLGVLATPDALKRAEEAGLDLVEVAPTAVPPVCRIMDYSKYKYEQEKREKEARKKQRVIHIKEVRMGPKIGEHDYQFKLHNLEDFLKRGDKVKVTMMFKGREMAHTEMGFELVKRIIESLKEIGLPDGNPKLLGKNINVSFNPRPKH